MKYSFEMLSAMARVVVDDEQHGDGDKAFALFMTLSFRTGLTVDECRARVYRMAAGEFIL